MVMMDKQEFNEDNVLDPDDIQTTDIKINPEYYIHLGILNAQNALKNSDVNAGLIQYFMAIEQLEAIAKSANKIIAKDKYDEAIKNFKESEDFKQEKNLTVQNARVANIKLKLILEDVFKNRINTMPITL